MEGERQQNKQTKRGQSTTTTQKTTSTTTPPTAATASVTPDQASPTQTKTSKAKKEKDRNGKEESAEETTSRDQTPKETNMEKTKTPPPPRTQQITPPTDVGDQTITIMILLFNVSCGSGTNQATENELINGIDNVLEEVEESINSEDSLVLLLVTDKVTETKHDAIEQHEFVSAQQHFDGAEAMTYIFNKDNTEITIQDVDKFQKSNACIQLEIDKGRVDDTISDLVDNLKFTEGLKPDSCFTEEERRSIQSAKMVCLEETKVGFEKTKRVLDSLYTTKIPKTLRKHLGKTSCFWSSSIPPLKICLLVVCWHGPYKSSKLEEKKVIFRELVQFVDNLREEYKADVAMIGGDFNLAKEKAQEVIDKMNAGYFIPPAPASKPHVMQTRNKTLDYLVVLPSQCKVEPEDIHQIFPLEEGLCKPFDHPALLYTLKLKHKHEHKKLPAPSPPPSTPTQS